MKTVKSTLLKELAKESVALEVIPCDTTVIIDAMAILQAIKLEISMTYKEFAHLIFSRIVRSE